MTAARIPLPIPNQAALVGGQFFSQFLWIDACGTQGLTTSDGIGVTLLQ